MTSVRTTRTTWRPDVLGERYEQRSIALGEDDEGEVVATLVRRRPDRPSDRPSDRAVLYVHGFIDYFFQTHLADFYVERGFDFYALDLRKYGRSLRPHQTPYFCRSVIEYFADLDAAVDLIRRDGERRTLLLAAHSTGGLIAALWAHRNRERSPVDGLALNSPFLDFNASWLLRTVVADAVGAVGKLRPYQRVPLSAPDVYGRSIHRDHHGAWDFDVAWKPIARVPIRAGWLRAIHAAHRRVHAGLAVEVPIHVACSTASFRGGAWDESVLRTDSVLDVEHIAGNAHRLGRHVTLARVEGGLHDLVLSPEPIRSRFLDDVGRWIDAYL